MRRRKTPLTHSRTISKVTFQPKTAIPQPPKASQSRRHEPHSRGLNPGNSGAPPAWAIENDRLVRPARAAVQSERPPFGVRV